MAVHERNDARGAARLLASNALDCIRHPANALERAVALNNVYRMLEAYRVNAFFGLQPPKHQCPAGSQGKLSLMPPAQRHTKEVRLALEQSVTIVFGDTPKDEAIKTLEEVLRGIAYPEDFDTPSEEDRLKATHFFDEVLAHLSPA